MHSSESAFNSSLSQPLTVTTPPDTLEKPVRHRPSLGQRLRRLATQFPQSSEVQQLQQLVNQVDWLSYFQRCSKLLVAVIEPMTLTLRYANDYFCQLTGIVMDGSASQDEVGNLGKALQQLLSESDHAAVQGLYRRHLLHLVFRDVYQFNLQGCRLLDTPVMLSLQSPLYSEPRYIEFWLRSEQLTLTRLDSQQDEFSDLGLHQMTQVELEQKLTDPNQLRQLEQRLQLENYRVEGWLLLEGADVTERETIRRITQLLIDQDSILQAEKFQEVDRQMRSLFRASNTVILSIEANQTRLFTGAVSPELDKTIYSLDSLQNSHFLEAVETNQVLAVPDLAQDCRTEGGQKLLKLGVRSLLLIPLVPQIGSQESGAEKAEGRGQKAEGRSQEPKSIQNSRFKIQNLESTQNSSPTPHTPHPTPPTRPPVVGLVGLMSDCPNHFDAIDCRHAEQLIPAFTTALIDAQRQLVQRSFITSIHPAVEWRFLQEAERRSLGLPAESIVFTEVYPLYGISDIRGSSDERNRAIQTDLLEQFQLGLAVLESACACQETALGEQLRQDLVEHIRQLQEGVTVDAEVSCTRYLRDSLEAYFDYFVGCGEGAKIAVEAYQAACNNEHQCVYQARARYDETIGKINALLRETWDRWQVKMQSISPHYCDTEATDGIDHMIYAGQSIDPKFGNFQLCNLRYEQLRAVCDCARTAFTIQEKYHTEMQVTHLVLVQDLTVDIFHDEKTERLFDVRGTRDTRYEIVKKRIDKAIDEQTKIRITQPGMLTIVYSTNEEWEMYRQYVRYLAREGWVDDQIEQGAVQPLQGVNGLKYARVRVLPVTQ
ncbi:GAF domain-containing protein [Kovacikia minuta CCNUW1]|uniref:GAF domain-containing protein n=1 Tax=Kovacikia minuta TaxID=2931930 RepID=UPI001CCD9B11|nr:GAF domain-containing protein [Kovacikia minuta]UBF27296.1 GAF domain-containing protein [Kovacikia minuta CCNUW1]